MGRAPESPMSMGLERPRYPTALDFKSVSPFFIFILDNSASMLIKAFIAWLEHFV